MARVFVSIGSNVERERNIRSSLRVLQAEFGSLSISTVYENAAVGFEGDDFFNLVAGFDTTLDVHAVVLELRRIEIAHGRCRNQPRFSARTLDLDLLLYDDLVMRENGLCIPRDEITRYAFVLRPLAELAADRQHPVLGATYAQLWQALAEEQDILRPVVLKL